MSSLRVGLSNLPGAVAGGGMPMQDPPSQKIRRTRSGQALEDQARAHIDYQAASQPRTSY